MSRFLRSLRAVFAAAFASGLPSPAVAQTHAEAGVPLLRELMPSEFPTAEPVFGAAQGPDGLLYFSSSRRLLEFDGHRVRELRTPDRLANALLGPPAVDARGRILVATTNHLSRFERDAHGEWSGSLITDTLPVPPGAMRGLLGPATSREGVCFASRGHVARWHEGKWTMLSLPEGHHATACRGNGVEAFVHTDRGELFRIDAHTLVSLGRFDAATHGTIVASDHLPDGRIRVVLDTGVVLAVAGDTTTTLWHGPPAVSAAPLPGGALAIATPSAGLFFFDASGRQIATLDLEAGLPSSQMPRLFAENDGRLWVTAASTLAVIDGLPAATRFDRLTGLRGGQLAAIVRHAGMLCVATDDGVYRLAAGGPGGARFQRVDGLDGRSWCLLVAGDTLLAGGRDGIHALSDGKFSRIATTPGPVNTLVVAAADTPFVYYGTNQGLGRLRRADHGWEDHGLHDGLAEVRSLAAMPGEVFWIGRARRIAVRAAPAANEKAVPPALDGATRPAMVLNTARRPRAFSMALNHQEFESGSRLPPGADRLRLVRWENEAWLAAEPGLFRYDEAGARFEPLPKHAWARGYRVALLAPVAAERAWVALGPAGTEDAAAPAWRVVEIARDGTLLRLLPASVLGESGDIAALFHETGPDGETLWVGGRDGLVRIALDRLPPPAAAPRVMLRAISPVPPAGARPQFAADTPSLRFEFAAPPAIGRRVAYQTRLGGADAPWSEFSHQAFAEFPPPASGRHAFAVRARNADGLTGPETGFAFAIAPPWWLGPWAWLGYACAGAGAIAGLVRRRLRVMHRRNVALETLVAERTEKLRASEQNLLVAKESAEAANRAKSTFLANMSHELRTPLNSILGFAQIMQRESASDERNARRLELVTRSGEHLLQLINDLLDLSRIEAGRIDLQPRPCALRRLLAELAEQFQARAAQKGLGFGQHQPIPLPEWVVADEHRLRQVLTNLLGNAVKFTEQGEIAFTITVRATEGVIRFEVRDTGIGIAPADLQRIFAPFQQAASAALAAQGAGLGLAISERLVALMGGKLEVESRPGHGSRFWFEAPLPLCTAPALASEIQRVVTGYRGARRRLLVVDDEANNRELLRDLLGGVGFDVVEAGGGDAALAACAGGRFDAALVDLRMPGIDGLALIPRLRATGGGARRIVALSASVFPIDREQAVAAGADEFLPKPIHESALFATLGRLLALEWTRAGAAAAPKPASGTPWERLPHPPRAALEALLPFIDGGDVLGLEEKLRALRAAHPAGAPFLDRVAALAANYQMATLSQIVRDACAREAGVPT